MPDRPPEATGPAGGIVADSPVRAGVLGENGGSSQQTTGTAAVSTGRRRAERRSGWGPLPTAALLAIGAIAAGVAWVFLVGAAIDFGHAARSGRAAAWVFGGAATAGAVVCLVLLFVLAGRVLTAVGLTGRPRPRRAAGRRIAR
jgi:hypothetical protein